MSQPVELPAGERPRAGKYHEGNPPLNLADARNRLNEVQVAVHQIEAKLRFAEKDDFVGRNITFESWMSRTTKALGYWRAEKDFLERWIRLKERLFSSGGDSVAESERGLIEGDFASRIEQAMLYMSSRYTPMYSEDNRPPSIPALKKQLKSAQHLVQRMDSVFAGLRDAAKVFGVSEEDMRLAVKPMADMVEIAKREVSFLHGEWRLMETADLKSLLAIIDRAVSQGLEMSEEEQAYITGMKRKAALQ